MNKIFIGLLFIFFDFNFEFGASVIDIIPDFIGYIIIYMGVKELADESQIFKRAQTVAFIMCIYSIAEVWCNLLGFRSVFYFTTIIGMAGYLYLTYLIADGVMNLEGIYGTDLSGTRLKQAWKYLALFSVLTYLTFISPVLATIFLVISFIVAIVYLVRFNDSKNRYIALPVKKSSDTFFQ